MVSGPKGATSWWDSVVYRSRIVINLLLDPEMRSPLALGNIGVMFSVHGDYIWVKVPWDTLSVGFEQLFVLDVMIFRFTDSRIAIKSLFPILTLFNKNKPPIFSRLLSAELSGGVKIWRGVVFFHHENMIYHNFVGFAGEFHHEVVNLGLGFIGLSSTRTKYLHFMMIHTLYVCDSYLIIRLAQ